MVFNGTTPNEFGFSCVLNACTGSRDSQSGREIHGLLTRLGYDSDPFTANALVDMYAKLGAIESATVVFERICERDIVSWNAFIAGCVLHGHDYQALDLLSQMKASGTLPNAFTLSSILKACAGAGMFGLGQQIHGYLIKADSSSDVYVGVGLVDMYAKSSHLEDAKRAFNSIPEKDLISWNALISGCSHSNRHEEALCLFSKMRKEGFSVNRTTLSAVLKSMASLEVISESKQVHALAMKEGLISDSHVANGLIDAYGKCGLIEEAKRAFEECPLDDVIAFTSMITALSQCGQGEEAIKLFSEMLRKKLEPDSFVVSSLLNACASLSAYEQGKQMHAHMLKLHFMSDVFAGNALVNMLLKESNMIYLNIDNIDNTLTHFLFLFFQLTVLKISAATVQSDGKAYKAGPWGGSGGNPSQIVFESGEYLTAMNGTTGSFNQVANVVRSLTFVTNVRKYGPFGVEQGTPFSIPVANGRIVGFYGRSGRTRQAWIMGRNGGNPRDIDGNPTRVSKIVVRSGQAIDSLAYDYDQDGKTFEAGPWGGSGGNPLRYDSGEFLTAINGTTSPFNNVANILRSLTFVTNIRKYGPFGVEEGTPFSVPVTNGRVVGFYGRSGVYVDALGIYLMPN
uniref:Jacalin-type lectin domain-containing protein n=1 Tax=Ananas comosus var. bracteatus TaxID=296719 RepID=A0A6V7NED8_ANACO|nr:unnamed protein product [Ananas comosus var. bracteatus]